MRFVCENHITREIDVWGRHFVCMGKIHSTWCVCLGKRDAGRPREWEKRCVHAQEIKVIDTYIGVRTLEERGVLMCSCVGVWGRERLLYVCVCVWWGG